MSTPENIILCGIMGTGKTTVGKIIAARLDWRLVDTDAVIERRQKKTIAAIFADEGEPAFRRLESALCAELIGWRRTVIATGGGIVLKPENREALCRAGMVVCLEAPAEVLATRLAGATDRPLLAGANPATRIAELIAVRAAAYAALPLHVNTMGHNPHEVADQIVALWKERVGVDQ